MTPGNEYSTNAGNAAAAAAYFSSNSGPPLPEPESPPTRENRFRRRISALRDADGRRAQYATRSQSNDHLFMLSRGGYGPSSDELEPIGENGCQTGG